MSEIKPRYEFRIWAETLTPIRERLERLASPKETVSQETYLVSATTDKCNAKIRADLMDIKVLVAEDRGLGVCREYRITSLTFTVRAALGSGKSGSRKRVHLIGCLRELAGPFFAAHAWLFLLFPQDICKALPERNSLSKLWVRQISFHSARTFCKPRSRNRRNPRHSLICPNTGSTIALRIRYRSRPASVFNFCFTCSSNEASALDSLASSSAALLGSPCFCFPVATCKSIPWSRASPTCFPFQ